MDILLMAISKIFSLRNYVMKQIMKPNKEGIMKIPDKGKVDFGEMIIKEQLFKKGIDPKAITSEKQLDNILNTPTVTPHSTPKKSGEVIEVDFDKGRWKDMDPEDLAGGGIAGMLGERVPFENAGKVDLSAILKGILPEREPPQLREDFTGQGGPLGRAQSPGGLQEVVDIQEANKVQKGEENLALGVLNYVMNNGDQELAENILIDLGEQLKISALTTMSGHKQDLFQKTGIVPINGETLYQAVIEADILGKYNLNATAIADAVGTKEILASLKYNNLGLVYNSENGQMEGEWKFEKKEGPRSEEIKWSLTPTLKKNDIQNSEEISLAFDKALGEGSIQLSASAKANQGGDQKTLKFNWTGKKGEDGEADTIDISHLVDKSGSTFSIDGTKSFDFYNVDGKEPSFS